MPDTRTFLYVLRPRRPDMLLDGGTPQEQRILQEHFEYLQARARRMHLFGRTANNDANTFGLVLFEAATESEAREVMAEDPAVKARVMDAELFPFRIAYSRGA